MVEIPPVTGEQLRTHEPPPDRPGPEAQLPLIIEGSGLAPDGSFSASDKSIALTRSLLSSRQAWRAGRGYGPARWLGAGVFAAVVLAIVVSIATGSAQAFAHYGPGFVWSSTYSPTAGQYAAGILIVGTVVTTGVAIIIAAPIGLGAAVALSELVPSRVAGVASTLVELLAAVPSIVVGLWALLVLSPLFARDVEPFLHSVPVLGLLFGGEDLGPSIILAAVVLAVMTLPTLVSLSRTALRAVPVADREAAMALGATRWQVVRKVVWPAARPGVAAATTLAVGRALGEAIAVAMVIGNSPSWPHSLAAPGATLGSSIVNQFSEAQPGLGTSSIIALGAVLFVLTVAVNIGGQALRRAGRTSTSSASYLAPAGPPAGAVPAPGADSGNAGTAAGPVLVAAAPVAAAPRPPLAAAYPAAAGLLGPEPLDPGPLGSGLIGPEPLGPACMGPVCVPPGLWGQVGLARPMAPRPRTSSLLPSTPWRVGAGGAGRLSRCAWRPWY